MTHGPVGGRTPGHHRGRHHIAANLENLTGTKFDDTLTGTSASKNVLRAYGGSDTVNTQDGIKGDTADGGVGSDTCTTDADDYRPGCEL